MAITIKSRKGTISRPSTSSQGPLLEQPRDCRCRRVRRPDATIRRVLHPASRHADRGTVLVGGAARGACRPSESAAARALYAPDAGGHRRPLSCVLVGWELVRL